MIIALFQRFCWLDERLQAQLRYRGWPDITRQQSMVMNTIVSGIVRPSDMARNLDVSRRAVQSTINQMIGLEIVRLDIDAKDRCYINASLPETGARKLQDAQRAMAGSVRFDAFLGALDAGWGDTIERKPVVLKKLPAELLGAPVIATSRCGGHIDK